jgi:nucleotide-binding universal stress UspA family protein
MTYSTVMVYVDAADAPERRLRLAASVADKFNATLIGISALAIRPAFVTDDALVQDLMQTDIKDMRGKLAERGSWFRAIAAADHRKLEWRALLDFPNVALAREARGADLVVIGRTAAPGDSYGTLDPGGAVLKIGRPALVVPDGIGALQADHVVIAWKDTREARRAVVDALPFLREASRVTVVEICESGEESAAQEHIDDVARYLSRHRIGGGPRVVIHQGGSGAAQLIRLARDEGADLIVSGAYGHSRLGEWMFGGMTWDLLATSPVCCVMSH